VKNTAKRCNHVTWRNSAIFHVTGYVTDVTDAHDSGKICLLLKWHLASDGVTNGACLRGSRMAWS
jgi:hypothetical protein